MKIKLITIIYPIVVKKKKNLIMIKKKIKKKMKKIKVIKIELLELLMMMILIPKLTKTP